MVQLITVAMFLIAGITGAMLCYIGKLSWRESTYKNYFSGSVVGGILCLVICLYQFFVLAIWPHIMWRSDVISFVSSPPAWYLLVLTFGPLLVYLWAGILMLRRRSALAQDQEGMSPGLRKGCLLLGILCLVCCVVEIPFSVVPVLTMYYPV